jgi:hypothetical protein
MSSVQLGTRSLTVSHLDGWVFLTAPWEDGPALQGYLRRHDIGSTLIRDPERREAALDLRTNLSVPRVAELLREWVRA